MKKVIFLAFSAACSMLYAGSEEGTIPTSDQMQVQVLNYANTDSVLQLKKFEVGVVLPEKEMAKITSFLKKADVTPEEQLNPFVDWDVDVEAVFYNKTTGKTQSVDAFFYVDYQRDQRKNDWKEIVTKFPFRVRFCPKETGEWTMTIVAKIHGAKAYSSQQQTFQVVPSIAHGFAAVHPNKRNLMVDNRIILPVGQNLVAPYNGVDMYSVKPDKTNKAALLDDWMSYHKDVRDYHEMGGQFIRIIQTAWASLIEFEEKGNYYNRMHYAWEQDKLIEYCEANGMMLNFNFQFQEPLMNYGQYYTAIWDFGHNEILGDGTYQFNKNDPYPAFCYNDTGTEEPHTMFLDENDLRYHEQRMRYYISRYGYSTSIMVFEFLSEASHLDQYYPNDSYEMRDDEHGKLVREALLNYHSRMSSYIKKTMEHTDHLLGVHGFDNTIFWQDTVAMKILDESCLLPTIDVVGFSTYKNEPGRLLITKNTPGTQVDNDENSYYQKIDAFWGHYGKPVMHFEQGAVGVGPSPNESSNFAPHNLDVRSVGFTGCAGFYVWEGYMHENGRDTRMAWPGTIAASQWMNSDSVIGVLMQGNGQWLQGRQSERHSRAVKKKTKETQYYVSSDKTRATGFVSNRTYNSYSAANSDSLRALMPNPGTAYSTMTTIAWDEWNKPLYVMSLKGKQNYKVRWYDQTSHALIKEEVLKTNRKGALVLQFPELTLEAGKEMRPVVWYTVELVN